jgi:hypothetical protein
LILLTRFLTFALQALKCPPQLCDLAFLVGGSFVGASHGTIPVLARRQFELPTYELSVNETFSAERQVSFMGLRKYAI